MPSQVVELACLVTHALSHAPRAVVTTPPALSPFYSVTPAGLRSRELTAGEGLMLVGGCGCR
jgi:hypothetical protein